MYAPADGAFLLLAIHPLERALYLGPQRRTQYSLTPSAYKSTATSKSLYSAHLILLILPLFTIYA